MGLFTHPLFNGKTLGMLVLSLVGLCFPFQTLAQEPAPASKDNLKQLLQRYPAADINGDGTLSLDEARRFRARMWQEQSDVGEPIDRAAPESSRATPADKTQPGNEPQFSKLPYGSLPGQQMNIWLPKDAAPPCPTAIYLSFHPERTNLPAFFVEQCLNEGITAVQILSRTDGDLNTYFEDVSTALLYLRERSVAYGIDPARMALYGEEKTAEHALLGGLLNLSSDAPRGVRCVALLDPAPCADEAVPLPETPAVGYLETRYPKLPPLLKEPHNAFTTALFLTQSHGGDELQQALEAASIKTSLHTAADGETIVHLRRMALLFIVSSFK